MINNVVKEEPKIDPVSKLIDALKEAKDVFENTICATEGMVIEL